MTTNLTALDFSIVVVYMLLVTVVGSVLGLFARNIKEYFAGGSPIPWYLGAISNYMTMMSTYVFVASAGIAYTEGIVAIVILWSAIPPTLVATFLISKCWLRMGIITPVEYLETRFNITVRQISSWGGVAFRILDNMIRLYAIGIFVSGAVGVPLVTAIVFCSIVVITFTMLGGLYGVVITDAVQCVILILTTLVLLPLALGAVGGLGALYQATPASFGLGNGPKGQTWFLAVYFLMILIKYNGNWAFIQRFYSMGCEKEARKMGLAAAVLYFILPILFLLPAIAGRVLFPELENPETVYVNVCKLLLPSGMMGLMIAAMFAATISTLSSEYNVTAGVLTRDIYQRLFRPAASERESMVVARLTTLLLGVLIMVGSLYIGQIGGAFEANKLFTGMLGVPIVVPLVFGVLWKRPKPIGAVIAMVGGFLIGLLFYLTEKFEWGTGNSIQMVLNEIAAWKWETKTFIQICCCLSFYFLSAFLLKRDAEYNRRVDAFFEKLKIPFFSKVRRADQSQLKYAMLLLLAISQLLSGGLFIFVSMFHWGTPSSQWAFGLGTACCVLAVIQLIVPRKGFYSLWAANHPNQKESP
ncbi:MAG: sodium/solute symporter [Planctomycetaceae bacterium]|nr:sodium/solute symporter [Planctomycetaceae bacterium]